MLSDTLFRVPRQNGLHTLQARGDGGARELSSWRVKLGPAGKRRFESQERRGSADTAARRGQTQSV